ncbi:unnamed protein product [Pleuronectes platessa]|uniref:Uncharacterized protein n=1 Tax=Pleuronectes platessa TaxID=8262 RepID=A0A9N7TPB2_PLEPL|nr:unnamed protein product [Pleuronectes platessa]
MKISVSLQETLKWSWRCHPSIFNKMQQRSRRGPADIGAERHHQRTRAGGSAGTPAPPQQLHGPTAPQSSDRGNGRQRRAPLDALPPGLCFGVTQSNVEKIKNLIR